jgi:predicted TPR repeat methyltransferase
VSYTAGIADGTAPSEVVGAGYNVVADDDAALECAGHEWPRLRWLRDMLAHVTPGARVLDVGCGNGIPATREIARQHEAIGIDISNAQIERATRNVRTAAFKRADLMEVEFTRPMYFSQHDADTTLRLLRDAGFDLVHTAIEAQREGDREVTYMWVLAQRRESGA